MGAFGLFALAIIDGSPIPTLGSLDVLTAILAARHREPWYFYGLVATVGGLIGSFITYSIARKAGESYLARKLGAGRVRRLLDFVRQWGAGTLIIATLFPPPFPATMVFAAAGILNYPRRRYLTTVAASRALRYGLLAWAGEHYGRHFILMIRHPQRYLGWAILIAVLLIAMVAAGLLMSRWIREERMVTEEIEPIGH
ncbi:MAG TPA: VTT domain-containing protein [Candidatus Bathyarchaeia archaeon]|nr:VTT domain-containing protein [Candidatus Bathyarchaeia archaeon]